MNFVLQGELRVQQAGRLQRVSAGQLAIIDNSQAFEVDIASPLHHRHMALRLPAAVRQLSPALLAQRLRPGPVADGFALLFKQIDRAVVEPGLHRSKDWLEMQMDRIEHLDPTAGPERAPGLRDVSAALGIPARSLQHHLARSNTSLGKVKQQVRLERARRSLIDTGLPIETIARHCGYVELSSFYRAFGREFGCAPGQLRRSGQGRDELK